MGVLQEANLRETDFKSVGRRFESLLPWCPIFYTESVLYRFIMRSEMPIAEKSQDWVTEMILPQIGKTGRELDFAAP
ncbi:MAG: BRO family protein [Syntrophobacter sp.]